MAFYIEEFFYRGRAPGEAAPVAMQVTIGQVPDGMPAAEAAKLKRVVGVFTPAQAAAAPYKLNLAALVGAATAEAAIAMSVADARIAELESALAATTEAEISLSVANARIAELEAALVGAAKT